MSNKVIILTQNQYIVNRIQECNISEPVTHIRTTKELDKYSNYAFLFLVDIAMAVYAKDITIPDCRKILILPTEREIHLQLLQNFDDYITLSTTNQIIAIRLNTYIKTIFESQNLTNNQNKYKQLVEQFGDSLILINEQGIICECNNRLCNVSGYTSSELLHSHIKMIFPDTYFLEQITENKFSGSLIETLLHPKKDIPIPKEIRLSKIILENELYYLVLARDIRERIKSLKKLEESEERFRRIFEIENDSLFLVDSIDGYILEVNEAATILYGYSREELLKKKFFNLYTNPKKLTQLIQDKRIRVGSEVALLNYNETCPVEISFAYFTWRGKHVFLAAVRDVSERFRVEKELRSAKERAEESDRLKSAFLANMSHEIRTPLNAIVGFSRLLARKEYPQEKRKLFIDDIQSNSNQLLTIINDILDISKIESGQFILTPTHVCINNLLQEVYDSIEVQLKNKDISLFCTKPLEDNKVTVIIDDVRLKQVLTNLMNNALKFTEKGYINFGYKTDIKKYITFFVEDTGIGIAADKQQIIFDHFRQEDDTTTRKYGGTGLGLSISKKLIELMGGKIWVESEKGKGSTFYVTIPNNAVRKAEFEVFSEPEAVEKDFVFSNQHIVIVDDIASSYIYISETFEGEQVKISHITSGEEAIEFCKKNTTIDLILMDIQMSGMNGVEAMQKIKKLYPHIPIIAQTAFAQKGDKEKFLNQGFDGYITKPLDEDKLKEIFRTNLK